MLVGTPRPHRIEVDPMVLDDLRYRLSRTRWPDPIPGVGWDYGTDIAYLRRLCERWADDYDWYAAQDRLNAHPQVLVDVDGVDLHALHIRGQGPDPFPLLLLHGWPGSVWEFIDVIGPLSDPATHGGDPADAFDVVVVSLPGFGFSGAPREPGWGVTRIATAMNRLMAALGYDHYGTQGGDWGGLISAQLGADHPERCVAIHVNQTYAKMVDGASEATEQWAERYAAYRSEEMGYAVVQGTKPDSLTVAQHDSPAGLAAWIIEKFRTWGDTGGDLESAFDVNDLLTNLTIWWVTGCAPSAARIYYEMRRDTHAQTRAPVPVPTGVAAFPREPFLSPRELTADRYHLVQWTDMAAGGHFAALEQPDALVGDVRSFYREVRSGRVQRRQDDV